MICGYTTPLYILPFDHRASFETRAPRASATDSAIATGHHPFWVQQ